MASKKNNGLNVFDQNRIRNQEGFLNYVMERTAEIEENWDRLAAMDFAARAGGESEVDTYACDCLFLRTFPTDDMVKDFPEIARDFLLHEYQNLPQYDQVEYITDKNKYDHPSSSFIGYTLNLMFNAAKQGNAYSIGLFQNLFQTYYKREYKQLKRFRKITRPELMAIADSDKDINEFFYMPILVTMCRMYGIEMDTDCYMLYKLCPDLLKRFHEDEEIPEFTGFPKEIVDQSLERISNEIASDKEKWSSQDTDKFAALRDYQDFVREAEYWLGLPNGFTEECDDELFAFELQLLRTLQILMSMDPDKEYSFDEILQKSVLLKAICALSCYHDLAEENLERLLGLNPDKYEYDKENSLFKPDKVKTPSTNLDHVRGSGVVKKKQPVAQTTDAVSIQKNEDSGRELQEELEKLRTKLRRQEQENQALREKNKELDLGLKEAEARNENYKTDHEELVHLRNYVFQMTEDEKEIPEVNIREMEKVLKDKKIVIIGGHSNWTYKLKNKFPRWVFFKPEISNTLDGKVLDDADYVYFFTDVLSHGTYGKYMKIIRSRGISSYGYIHSINIASNIRQVFGDVSNG